MFKDIEENDNITVDSTEGIFEGYVSDLSDNYITIYSYVDDRNVMLKKSDVLEISKKIERRKEVKAEVKQSSYFGIQAIAEMKNISVDEAVTRVLEKYAWKEVEFLQDVSNAVENIKDQSK